MERPKMPLWKKSIINKLSIYDITEFLSEISENGDMYGYEREEIGYYQDYKDMFDELSCGAYHLYEAISDWDFNISENWDDITVGLLGELYEVSGYDTVELDYFKCLSDIEEEFAQEEAVKRLKRLTKDELIRSFGKVLKTLVLFFDLKASHDCLTAVVEELDNRGAMLKAKNKQLNILYEDLTGKNEEEFDSLIERLPDRMWIE